MPCIALLIYWACLCILFQHALLPHSLPPSLPLSLSISLSCLHKLLLLTVLNYRSFCICMFDFSSTFTVCQRGMETVKRGRWRDSACPSASSDGFQNPLTNTRQLSEQGASNKPDGKGKRDLNLKLEFNRLHFKKLTLLCSKQKVQLFFMFFIALSLEFFLQYFFVVFSSNCIFELNNKLDHSSKSAAAFVC